MTGEELRIKLYDRQRYRLWPPGQREGR